jgi:cyclophilin family peptidyl-prolyl cis-trans isomerase
MNAAASDPALAAIDAFITQKKIDTQAQGWKTRLPKPPKLSFEKGRTYTWKLVTSEGPIGVRLLHSVAPMHVSSTVFLTRVGFYDGLVFHRVIDGFMAQGGCPLGTGTGQPGYQYDGEFDKSVRHDRKGLLSMANTGRPTTDGSQFFLTFVPTPHLDDKHTIFGEVVSGMDTLGKLEAQGSRSGQTKKKVFIEKATIEVS